MMRIAATTYIQLNENELACPLACGMELELDIELELAVDPKVSNVTVLVSDVAPVPDTTRACALH